MLTLLCNCSHKNNETAQGESSAMNFATGVSIELSMPYGDSLRWLGLCWDQNPVDIIIRNQTDSTVYFYEDWNSWGFYNFKFQIETEDSVYLVTRTNHGWWKNFPSIHHLNPKQSLVFHYNLIDSACTEHNASIERIKGLEQWTGLPQREYDYARIQVVYELPEEYKYLINHGFRNLNAMLGNGSDSPIMPNDTTFMFSHKLISEPIDIKIIN